MKPRCAECAFFNSSGPNTLNAVSTCHRFPPVQNYQSGFPKVAATDWCGEFKPIPAVDGDAAGAA